MIASLRGNLISRTGARLVVEVAGVGYSVAVTERFAAGLREGESVVIHTALVVRDDDLSLYGFADPAELSIFDLLRTVPGVGPKSALGVLGSLTTDQIAAAIVDDDDAPFRAVSGIGPKTAKLIVVTLAGKLVAPLIGDRVEQSGATITSSLAAALTGLGWPERRALEAATGVVEADPDAESTGLPVLLRRALTLLGPARSLSDAAETRP